MASRRSSAYPQKFQGHARKRSSAPTQDHTNSLPIPLEARPNLGLAGTMGGFIGGTAEQEFDASNPDSDVPDELQVILSNSDQEDTLSFDPPTLRAPGLPPEMPLPVPRDSAPEMPVCQADIEEAVVSSEDDTKKSFYFTGEIKKRNKSGASHRRSFMEQLEYTFRTPTKIDLRYNFGNFLVTNVPPVSKNSLQDKLVRKYVWPAE